MAYAREVERIEGEKARQRMIAGKNQYSPTVNLPEASGRCETRDKVAQTVGYGSGKTYQQVKAVIETGIPELVAKLDAGMENFTHRCRALLGLIKERKELQYGL